MLDGAEAVSEKFTDSAEAEQAAAACKGSAVTCTSVTKAQKKEQPPKLYDLTTLQREANRLLGYTAKQTLDYAQSLYEKKLLTYPRTDSRYLTSDMAETASCVIHLAAKLPPFDSCSNFFPLDLRQGCIRPPRHYPHNGDRESGYPRPAPGRA